MPELNENTSFNISLKTLIAIGFSMATIISMWFVLQSDINEAKKLPIPEVPRIEFTLKDEMVRNAIFQIQKDLDEVKESLKEIEKNQ